jgi:hypothetical protein
MLNIATQGDTMNRRKLIQALGALFATPAIVKANPAKTALLLQQSPIAGFQYYEGGRLWSEFECEQVLTLQRETDNAYDKRAVAIYWQNKKLGYIPRRDNATISQLLDRGQTLHAKIDQLNDNDDAWKRMKIAVSVNT